MGRGFFCVFLGAQPKSLAVDLVGEWERNNINPLMATSRNYHALDIKFVIQGHSMTSSESRHVNFSLDAGSQL